MVRYVQIGLYVQSPDDPNIFKGYPAVNDMAMEDIVGDVSQWQWWVVLLVLIGIVYTIKRRKIRKIKEEYDL